MSERYISRHKRPSDHEREVLEIIQEECAEVIIAISKTLRFGWTDGYPGTSRRNRKDLGLEIGQLQAIIAIAKAKNMIRERDVVDGMAEKYDKLNRYMQTQPDVPTKETEAGVRQ